MQDTLHGKNESNGRTRDKGHWGCLGPKDTGNTFLLSLESTNERDHKKYHDWDRLPC